MDRTTRRKIRKKAEKVWELEKKIKEASDHIDKKAYVDAIKQLNEYTKELSLEDMFIIDDYISEYLA